MNFNFIYILGLFVSITGFASCLTTAEDWSQWAIVQQDPCLRLRTTLCAKITVDCNSTKEFSRCPPVAVHWEEWSPMQCTVENGTKCIITRTRNCSVPTLTKCQSNATGHAEEVWKDMNTCPCREGVKVQSNQGPGQWGHWGGWQCQTKEDSCYIFRIRQCSVADTTNCPPSDRSQIKPYNVSDCPCVNGTLIPGYNNLIASTESPGNPTWSDWGPWECHKEQVLCVLYRYRHCINGQEVQCKRIGGTYYEMNGCDDSCDSKNDSSVSATTTELPDASATSVPPLLTSTLKYFISTVTMTSPLSFYPSTVAVHLTTSTKTTSAPPPKTSLTTSSSTSPSTSTVMSPPTSPPTSTTKDVPIYWLEWTGWDCKDINSTCLMSHTRNCSTFNTDDCKNTIGGIHYEVHTCRKEICPAEWLDWGEWKCKMGYNGTCNMLRTRECSTGSTISCGQNSSMTMPCERQICQDKFDRQESGVCRSYSDTTCTDATSCDIIKDSKQLICSFKDTATESCPKACGCCEEEPNWLEWSAWGECIRLANKKCGMKRTRNCSTSNTRDCQGMSEITAACIDSTCPDCTEFYSKSMKCEDGPGCFNFTSFPNLICTEPKEVPSCPILCGCCVVPTKTTTTSVHGSILTTSNTSSGSTTSSPTGTSGTNSINTGSGFTTVDPTGPGGTSSNSSGSSRSTTIDPTSTSGTNSTTIDPTGTGSTTIDTTGTVGTNGTNVGSGSTTSSTTDGTYSSNTGSVSTTINPSGTGGTKVNATGNGSTTSPSGTGGTNGSSTGNGSTTTGSGRTTIFPTGTGVISNNTSGTNDTSQSTDTISAGSSIASTMVTTTQVVVKTTTHKPPYTIPPKPTTCKVCSGPLFLCEKLYVDKTCDAPNNYCINKLSNHKDGTRTITRDCGSFDTCYRDWFLGSSDSDKCRNFEDNNIITLDFDCTYCCINDGCNESIRPSDNTLYKDL